jgi:hypothetical protein
MQQIALGSMINEPEVRELRVDENDEPLRISGDCDPDAMNLEGFESPPLWTGCGLVPKPRIGPRAEPEFRDIPRAVRFNFLDRERQPGLDPFQHIHALSSPTVQAPFPGDFKDRDYNGGRAIRVKRR